MTSTCCEWDTAGRWERSPTSIRKASPRAAFHGFPDMLRHDPISGDYGPNFFGHAWNTATYIVDHPEFGWVAFGGNTGSRATLFKSRLSIPSARGFTWLRWACG